MHLGSSVGTGKDAIQTWLTAILPNGGTILDVGAGHGTYRDLLPDPKYVFDAVECYQKAWSALITKYATIYGCDIRNFKYLKNYNIIIFGDILEHLTVAEAQKVLEDALKHCECVLVAVPFEYPQSAIEDNPAEEHLQPDLTFKTMQDRYPKLRLLLYAEDDNAVCYEDGSPFHLRYAYYFAKGEI